MFDPFSSGFLSCCGLEEEGFYWEPRNGFESNAGRGELGRLLFEPSCCVAFLPLDNDLSGRTVRGANFWSLIADGYVNAERRGRGFRVNGLDLSTRELEIVLGGIPLFGPAVNTQE